MVKEGYRASIDKSKWVQQSDFKAYIGKATTSSGFSNSIDTYVARDPSQPAQLYKFR